MEHGVAAAMDMRNKPFVSCGTPNDPGTGGGRATPGIDHGRCAPGSGRPRERDAPSSPGVGHTPGIATTPGSPGWGMTPGTSGHFFLQIGKTEQKQSKNKKSVFSLPA